MIIRRITLDDHVLWEYQSDFKMVDPYWLPLTREQKTLSPRARSLSGEPYSMIMTYGSTKMESEFKMVDHYWLPLTREEKTLSSRARRLSGESYSMTLPSESTKMESELKMVAIRCWRKQENRFKSGIIPQLII